MTAVDDYLADIRLEERKELERLRQIVHGAVPQAEEVKTYGMPGFKYNGKYLASFAAFKDHLSFFPGALPDDILPKLTGFTLSKGTIQFTLDKPVPESIIKELLVRRVAAIDSKT